MQFLTNQSHVAVEVGEEAFELAYVYFLALLAEHAMSLTLLLVRTYASAHSRQITLFVNDVHGIAEVSHRQLVNPVWYVMAYWASLLALWYLAVQTTLGFFDSFVHSISLVNLFE